ncbi:MAG: hypothetical protein P1Q69_13615 [Candidatus Thorarchaeota archaeon]|nr:hypothetical protein [Candidatus Thorarchaeota archaeon]
MSGKKKAKKKDKVSPPTAPQGPPQPPGSTVPPPSANMPAGMSVELLQGKGMVTAKDAHTQKSMIPISEEGSGPETRGVGSSRIKKDNTTELKKLYD